MRASGTSSLKAAVRYQIISPAELKMPLSREGWMQVNLWIKGRLGSEGRYMGTPQANLYGNKDALSAWRVDLIRTAPFQPPLFILQTGYVIRSCLINSNGLHPVLRCHSHSLMAICLETSGCLLNLLPESPSHCRVHHSQTPRGEGWTWSWPWCLEILGGQRYNPNNYIC